jgi:hypothetical protein
LSLVLFSVRITDLFPHKKKRIILSIANHLSSYLLLILADALSMRQERLRERERESILDPCNTVQKWHKDAVYAHQMFRSV